MKKKKKTINSNRSRITEIHQIPGAALYSGIYHSNASQINCFEYAPDYFKETIITTDKIEKLSTPSPHIQWISVAGLSDNNIISKLGKSFAINNLILEDIVTPSQRPKLEVMDNGFFLVLKLIQLTEDNTISTQHFSIVFQENKIITFQETNTTIFDQLTNRIAQSLGRIRNQASDYLLYSILDVIIDHYFSVVESLSYQLEDIEDRLFHTNHSETILHDIQYLKKSILHFGRNIRPIKDIINHLNKSDTPQISSITEKYIADALDHITQIIETNESNREIIWSLMDLYMTNTNNKMNEIMKVLTIMSSIFIPLTFIAGIYGMNFDNMPELHFKNSYFFVLTAMGIITLLLLLYFRKKKWL